MRSELLEAQRKVTDMENVVRKSERSLAVSRQDQMEMSASLAGNVGKLDRLLKQAKSMRQERADQMVEINAGRRRQKTRLKVQPFHVALPAPSYLIPTFLVCIKALQDEALRYNQEKQESNRTKRAAQRKAKRFKQRLDALREEDVCVENEMGENVNNEDDVIKRKCEIRFPQRNKGIKADFEQHVRCVLATGMTARQAQDSLLLDANYMLPMEDAATFTTSLPLIRWFQDQREALGIESYLYGFMKIAAASRVVQVQ